MTGRMTIIAVISLCLVGTALAQEKVTLKQVVDPGKYTVTRFVEANQVKTTHLPGKPDWIEETRTTLKLTGDMVLETPDKDGTKKGTFVYRRISEEIISGPNSMKYDSDEPNAAAAILTEAMKFVMSPQFSFDLLADGNVGNIKGNDSNVWTQFRRSKAGEDANLLAMVPQAMMYVDRAYVIKDVLVQSFLPEGPVALGDLWKPRDKRDPNNPNAANTKLEFNAKLAAVEGGPRGKARIENESKSHLEKATELPGYTLEQCETSSKAVNLFDIGRNLVVSYKGFYFIETVAATPLPEGQKIRTVMKRDSVIESSITPEVQSTAPQGTTK